MAKDDSVEHLSQELTSDDTQKQQQQQKPFCIVLVDIERAAKNFEIHCVEKPLEEKELNFVALSYRWGEVHETIIDTHLDYLATITSFDLTDFYKLCHLMTLEPDLKSIQYVWVDAICVNQSNYEQRKATIHRMTDIYHKAAFILAVPDLHLRHLKNVSAANKKIMKNSSEFSEYMYHLIQGNTDQLHQLDDTFLDKMEVPDDRRLRQWLATYSTYLTHGFTTFQQVNANEYHSEDTLDFLCDVYQASKTAVPDLINIQTQQEDDDNDDHDKVACLLEEEATAKWRKIGKSDRMWTHKLIRRKNTIKQAMQLCEDLIVDWSTRVWVISEYNIAKKKNNLKYWFIQLISDETFGLPFFNFDFTNPAFSDAVQKTVFYAAAGTYDGNPVNLLFHRSIIKQLNTQSFLEMMLKSMASKNEDRFYAILPQSKYKHQVIQVADWNIHTLFSVKLKLFEIMDTNDKWHLLFLSGNKHASNTFEVLPTFCASTLFWRDVDTYITEYPCNTSSAPITLHHTGHLHYLQLTPLEYYVKYNENDLSESPRHQNALYNHLQLDKHSVINIVYLTQYDLNALPPDMRDDYLNRNNIALIGSFEENKWVLYYPGWYFEPSKFNHIINGDDSGTVFNIY
ncbi:unnamed protein product [Absidia cylindrospora]